MTLERMLALGIDRNDIRLENDNASEELTAHTNANLKLLAGNPGRRPLLNPNEAKLPRVELPLCPKHLTGEGRKEWRRTGRRLAELRIMTDIDRAALAIYCTVWSRYVDAERQLEKARRRHLWPRVDIRFRAPIS